MQEIIEELESELGLIELELEDIFHEMGAGWDDNWNDDLIYVQGKKKGLELALDLLRNKYNEE